MENRVISALENVHALNRRRETIEKLPLRLQIYDPILFRAEHQRRRMYRPGVSEQAFRRVMKIEQNIDRDLPKDQRVRFVNGRLLVIVRQHFRFDVTLHVTAAKQGLFQPQRRNSEGNVELHVKSRRRQNHGANRRRIIMHPRRHANGGKTVREQDHVLQGDAVRLGNMSRKRVYIFDHSREIFRRAAFSRREAVAARIPCKYGHVAEV